MRLTRAGQNALETFAPIVKASDVAIQAIGSAPVSRPLHIIAPVGYMMIPIVRRVVSRFQALYLQAVFGLESGRYGGEALS